MKAAVYRNYGAPGVVKIEEVSKPEPKAGEVLIKIRAATVSAADSRIRSLTVPRGFGLLMRLIFGMLRPRSPILGTELAGEVEAIGEKVTKFNIGDHVFAFPGGGLGGHAEYRTMPEDGRIELKPANLSFEEAAAISFGGATALYYLRDVAKVREGEKVLVIGASGAVGSAAVQLAKYFGASVTGTCSTANLELVRMIGADHVVDYTKADFTQNAETYDIILDAVGAASFASCKGVLRPHGRLLLLVADLGQMLGAVWGTRSGNKRVFAGPAQEKAEQMTFLKQLCETGKFKPVIDQCFPLERIAEAHARVDTGRKRGSVVVTVGPQYSPPEIPPPMT